MPCKFVYQTSLLKLTLLFKERDGWYGATAFEQIKTVLRHKFYSLLDGYIATDTECESLLVPTEETGRVPIPHHLRKSRHHKHNMAKGALPPEDAAVCNILLVLICLIP
jgi:general transcription factor 3C polypeptide 5 (transcription factor C subunit 1)